MPQGVGLQPGISVDAENCVYTYIIVQFGQFVFLISLYAITNIDFGNTV